jgi:threonine/homoserine/homoserine lactone efflux protein
MIDFIQNTTSPFLAAFLIGLLFSLDACPMMTNIAAIGYISKDLKMKKRIFIGSLCFISGRIAVLGLLSCSLIFTLKSSIKMLNLVQFFLDYGEFILMPVLLIFGLLLIYSDKIRWLNIIFSAEKFKESAKSSNIGAFVLGAVLSLAFCPSNFMLFFGILVPLSATFSGGWVVLPLIFSITTAIPVILIVLIMAFGIKNIDEFYKISDKYSKIAIKVIGIMFIITAIYMFYEHTLLH